MSFVRFIMGMMRALLSPPLVVTMRPFWISLMSVSVVAI